MAYPLILFHRVLPSQPRAPNPSVAILSPTRAQAKLASPVYQRFGLRLRLPIVDFERSRFD